MSSRPPTGGGSGNPSGGGGTDRATPDVIDFEYDHATEGDVSTNAEVTENDYTTIHGDQQTATNEVIEVAAIDLIPPKEDDGSLQSFDHIRLYNGESYYPHLRYREFMLGWYGPDFHLPSVPLGTPILGGETNPEDNPIDTATPKYGANTSVVPRLQNNGTAITDSFRIRLHVWRWQGTDQELQNYINRLYNRTQFRQNITMSNPFTGSSRTYQRGSPIEIRPGATGGAKGQFAQFTGGVEQELPKVFPWVTWTENNNATRANRQYEFTTRNDKVVDSWKRLEHDFTDQKEAIFFDYLMVNQPDNLQEGVLVFEDRDEDPRVWLQPNSAHELPFLRPPDGRDPVRYTTAQVPVRLADRLGNRQVLWDDGGGFRIQDDGTSIGADNILIGALGKRLELTS
jgi:hypothetical protein